MRAKVSPNSVSLASLVFAALGAALLLRGAQPWCLVAAAACVQLRLCCNLLDGMVAIEGRRQTPTGVLYNELPARVADSMRIVALGFAVAASWLGWLGALAAALTAYIRVLGGSLGFPQDFRGPLAKPQRMAVLTGALLIAALELAVFETRLALLGAAWVIALGSLVTCVARARAIAARLHERGAA